MAVVLVTILEIFSFALIARAIFSWFRPDPDGFMGQINEVLLKITEPVVGPVRRLLPSTGPLDISVLLVLLVINFVLVPIAANL
jgi:YggT family protein